MAAGTALVPYLGQWLLGFLIGEAAAWAWRVFVLEAKTEDSEALGVTVLRVAAAIAAILFAAGSVLFVVVTTYALGLKIGILVGSIAGYFQTLKRRA